MNSTLANIMKYAQLALAGTYIAEQTMAADAGATKKQFVMDTITNEAQLAGTVVPAAEQPIVSSIVNIAVAAYNLTGIFTHKTTATATSTSTAAAAPAA